MNRKGFTLVEIMIVVAIISLLAAVAIPNLLRARITAQEAAAAGAMHTILNAQIQWRATNSTYASLSQFDDVTPPYIDSGLASGTKSGYNFTVYAPTVTQFWVCAMHMTSQAHSFYIDEDGMLCRSNQVGQSCPLDHRASSQQCPDSYFTEVE